MVAGVLDPEFKLNLVCFTQFFLLYFKLIM